ncbi:general odorant-binding protein 69a-like [Photinus pyralis]|uniref:general odorant-binding protein 69a-like n=1 Tax=Photinus pyralis TaxID=7054 RepID=UPI001266E764|nr:general odorant-binding protein 69a-like [Photinus pyralis]
MKSILLALLIVPLISSLKVDPEKIEWWESVIKPHVEKCKVETKVDPNFVDRMKFLEFPDEPNFRCFVKCLYTGIGVIDSEGRVNVEKVAEKLTFNSLEKAESCKRKAEAKRDSCERPYRLLLCIVRAASDKPESD